MIWIVLDPDSGDYELIEFEIDGQKHSVIDPQVIDEIDWAAIRPAWLKEHGTLIVLLGSEEYPDTVLGNPHAGEKDIKGLSVYLNSRFWDLSEVDVKVMELRTDKKNNWPTSATDKDDARRPNNRSIRGAKYYLTEVTAPAGKLSASDMLFLDQERVVAEWYLWEGDRPAIHSYAKKSGYVAIRYKGELFQLTASKVHFRWFGVIESKVQQNLFVILEPQLYEASNGRWGVHPDQSRNRLIYTGSGEKGVELPMADWGLEFAENMPDAILEAIRLARGEGGGSVESDEYRKRLQDRFGDRWRMKKLVKAKKTEKGTKLGTETSDDDDVSDAPTDPGPGERHRRKRSKVVKVLRRRMTPNGSDSAVEREAPVDVPRYQFANLDSFDKAWHIAMWAPNDPDGPTVFINVESNVLQEVIEYHQAQYPDVHAEEIATAIRHVFGEIAVCKIAHSQKLAMKVAEEELDRDYRSEPALTLALMGLLAEESVIATRLGKFGKKKAAAVAEVATV